MVGLLCFLPSALYGYFFWQTQVWNNFDPDYPVARRDSTTARRLPANRSQQRQRNAGATGAGARRPRPAPADTASRQLRTLGHRRRHRRPDRLQRQPERLDLVDAALQDRALRHGLGITPWFDNKASFQRGVNQVVRRTTVELVDSLGRVRGTSQINQNLQERAHRSRMGRIRLVYRPARPDDADAERTIATPSATCAPSTPAWKSARRSSTRAPTTCCEFLDRISSDIGSTSRHPARRSKLRMAAGSIRAPMTASGSPTASSTAITASCRPPVRTFAGSSPSAT